MIRSGIPSFQGFGGLQEEGLKGSQVVHYPMIPGAYTG